MARKEETEIEFRPKGLGELKAKWADFAGDLLEPVVLLAAGATKAQAAWAGFRGILESRVLGPLGLVAGASIGFLATTRLLVSQWRTLGMTAAGALERMTLQFRPLLGSLASAKERVKELSKFAVKTPFEIGEIVEANKLLQTLTQGALANEKGMTLVGDAASVAGQAFSSVAQYVGRLYDGLMSGRPVGEATMRLQEMAIISGTVRNQIESMQAANVSGLEIWKVVEKQLQRNAGAMDAQSKGLEGLQSTYNDTKNAMEGGFSAGFLDGEKAGVEAATKVMEAMTPVMTNLGKELGAVENKLAEWKLGLVKAVTSSSAFGSTVEWIIKGAVGLAAVLAGASGVAIAGFTVRMLKLMAGNKAAAASTEYLAKVEAASIPATTKLASVKNALRAASNANAAGLKAEALANLGAAAAGAKNLAATNGLVGAVKVGGMAMNGFGLALRFVGVQLKAMAVAMLANPMVWLAGAVLVAVEAFSALARSNEEAAEKLNNYQKATQALDSGMKKQIADIRTMVDLRQAESKILTELVGAYRAVESAKTSADKKAAEERVEVSKQNLGNLPAVNQLEKPDDEMERDRSQRDGARQVFEYQRDAIAAKGPEDALRIAEQRMKEVQDKRRAAMALENQEAAASSRATAIRQNGIGQEGERQGLMQKQARLEKERADLGNVSAPGDQSGIREAMRKKDQEIQKVKGALQDLAAPRESSALKEELASPSELQQIKAKIAIMDELKVAIDRVDVAQNELAQNTDKGKTAGLQDTLLAALQAKRQAMELASQAGVTVDPRARQALDARKSELEGQRGEDLDLMREVEAERARKDAALALAQTRLDAEAAVEGLRMKGYDRDVKLLEIEQQKLDLRLQAESIGRDEYDRQRQVIQERRAQADREAEDRRFELQTAFQLSALKLKEEEARRNGNPIGAGALRDRMAEIEDARVRKEAQREAVDVAVSPEQRAAYVEDRVKQAQAAREAERKREEEERAAGRGRSSANQGSAVAAIEAERLRMQGKTKDARRVTEEAARKQDELDRTEASKRYREQGFGKTRADQMADRDVKTSQAQRMIEEMGRGGGTVVASSLAKIGGGGNVAGTDPSVRLQEQMVSLLRQIANEGKNNVDYEPPFD